VAGVSKLETLNGSKNPLLTPISDYMTSASIQNPEQEKSPSDIRNWGTRRYYPDVDTCTISLMTWWLVEVGIGDGDFEVPVHNTLAAKPTSVRWNMGVPSLPPFGCKKRLARTRAGKSGKYLHMNTKLQGFRVVRETAFDDGDAFGHDA